MINTMEQHSATKKASLIALEVCVVLILGSLYIWKIVDLSSPRIGQYFMISIFISVGLLTVLVYQSVKLTTAATALAENMVQGMLQYSKDLFTEMYRRSPVPYILIDADGNIESTNFAALRLFAVEEGWLTSKNIFSYIEGDNADHISLLPEYFRKGVSVNDEEVRVLRADETSRTVILSLFSFIDSKKKSKGLLTLVDVTKQKEIDKAKTEFVSLASHQLRTPISSMKWNIELFHNTGKDNLTGPQQEYLQKIEHGLMRMDTLVDDFLNVSKFELGTLTPQKVVITVREFVDSILEEYSKHAERKSIQIEQALSAPDLTINTDTHLLGMTLGNLLSNAIKYTPEHGVVRMTVARDGEHMVFTVADTGMGIPFDEQARVFSKIFRATNARTNVPDGTGLGLYIAHEAIKVLGGELTFVSKENEGTTFTITLPSA